MYFAKGNKFMVTLVNAISILKPLRVSRLFDSAILILSLVLAANAQGVGSSRGLSSGDGIHTIQGRVHFPAGQSRGSSSESCECRHRWINLASSPRDRKSTRLN